MCILLQGSVTGLVTFSEESMSLFGSWIRIPIWQQTQHFLPWLLSSCEHDHLKKVDAPSLHRQCDFVGCS